MGVEESLRKFEEIKKGTPHQPNIVKVIKGGQKWLSGIIIIIIK